MWMNRCIILFPLVTISLYSRKVIFAFDNCSYNLFSQECFEFQYLEFLLCHFQIPALDKFLFDVKDLKSNLSHAELVPAKQSLMVCIHNYTFFLFFLWLKFVSNVIFLHFYLGGLRKEWWCIWYLLLQFP